MDFSNYTLKELLKLYWKIEGELFKRTWWLIIISVILIIFSIYIKKKRRR